MRNAWNYKSVDTEIIKLVNEGKTSKQIQEELNIAHTTLFRKLKRLNINIPNRHNATKFNEHIFDKIDSEEKAYWLGFIYADGYISDKGDFELSLSIKDKDHLDKFNLFMEYQGNNVKIGNSKCGEKVFQRCRFSVRNKHLAETLNTLGVVPRKSLTLKFPNINIFDSSNLIPHFIRGYVDGDGSLEMCTREYTSFFRIQIIGTKEFLDGIVDKANLLTNIYHKDKRHPESNTFSISISRKKALEFANFLYKDATIYLRRKFNIYSFAVLSSNI